MREFFNPCEICENTGWKVQYKGKVRDGAFGNLTNGDCVVAKCSLCGIERLNEAACKNDEIYETDKYRRLLEEPLDAAGFMAEHDVQQLRNLTVLWPESLRYKVIADIGCGAGSFLDHISGLAREVIAVEPCLAYHDSLKERGYTVYSYAKDIGQEWCGKIDFSFCFSVIEHIENPKIFLSEIRELLAPEGKLIVSTPNCHDILMDLKGEEYKRFFYRTVHRWYFDMDSFKICANKAGLQVLDTYCVHRFGLSNAMAWVRDGKPTGSKSLPHLESVLLDNVWKNYLESHGRGDYLYFKLGKS